MPKKIDPLNKKNYGAITAALCVTDMKAATSFYQKAFGFEKRGTMNGPGGKPVHAELRLRDSTLMLGPEMPEMGARSAKTAGASPTTLYLLVDNVDKVFAKAVKLGAKPLGTVEDTFWGDRCGRLVDPEGYTWYIATHIAEPTPAEMKKQMLADMKKWQAQQGQANAATNER
jgi:PhnB protein